MKHALKAQHNTAQWQRLGSEMRMKQNRALKGQHKNKNMETNIILQDRKTENVIEMSFMFQLTIGEFHLIFQNGTSSWGGTRKLPFAFTEQGVAMLSGILRSQKAILENIKIMRAFVAIRQYVLNYTELKHELDNFMRETNAKFDKNDMKFDALFKLL